MKEEEDKESHTHTEYTHTHTDKRAHAHARMHNACTHACAYTHNLTYNYAWAL